MRKNILRIILVILILCWMLMVFNFSSHVGEKSSGISLKIARIFTQKEDTIRFLEPIIRKLAHLSEFAMRWFFDIWFILKL